MSLDSLKKKLLSDKQTASEYYKLKPQFEEVKRTLLEQRSK